MDIHRIYRSNLQLAEVYEKLIQPLLWDADDKEYFSGVKRRIAVFPEELTEIYSQTPEKLTECLTQVGDEEGLLRLLLEKGEKSAVEAVADVRKLMEMESPDSAVAKK